jgi:hypothetical protein
VGIGTLARYLIGDRGAILEVAANRHALWVGVLFVLSAGFAREYDGEDLLHEPWHLLIPLGASLASSFVLFTVAYGIAILKGEPWRPYFRLYLSFLGLFWLTAPLAWLYAVPYERFLDPVGAVKMNLLTLGVVAAWRVLLMIRVLVVLMDYHPLGAASLVLLFGDAVALAVMSFVPVPLIDVMGGLRLSERDQILRNVTGTVCLAGACSLPVWVIGSLVVAGLSHPSWQAPLPVTWGFWRPTRGLQALALASVVAWFGVLPFTQPEQQLRCRVERAFREGRIADALAEMSAHPPTDFPPHWEPPPRHTIAWGPPEGLLDILRTLGETESAPWVREVYIRKLTRHFRGGFVNTDREFLHRLAAVLKKLPEGPSVVEGLEREGQGEAAAMLRRAMEDDRPKEEGPSR